MTPPPFGQSTCGACGQPMTDRHMLDAFRDPIDRSYRHAVCPLPQPAPAKFDPEAFQASAQRLQELRAEEKLGVAKQDLQGDIVNLGDQYPALAKFLQRLMEKTLEEPDANEIADRIAESIKRAL